MKKTIIFSAPYMMTSVERFRKVLEGHYGIEMIVPDVKQKLLEDDIIKYAGQFDGTICGDDEYSARVIEACSPRLKVVSKWGTGIDAIDKEACKKFGVMIGNNAFRLRRTVLRRGEHTQRHCDQKYQRQYDTAESFQYISENLHSATSEARLSFF